jgi:sulfate adenylyltransferase
MRLDNGILWPISITLDVSEDEIARLGIWIGNFKIVLVQGGHLDRPLVIMTVMALFSYDKQESRLVYNTTDVSHPAVAYLMQEAEDMLIGGPIEAIDLPMYRDFVHMCRTPSWLRSLFETNRWDKVVAFQTRNPMHRAPMS